MDAAQVQAEKVVGDAERDGDKIYGVWYDEQDVPYVVRLGIVGDVSAAQSLGR